MPTGSPTKASLHHIGGPVDVAFVGRTAYVLVTLVSGEIFGEPFGDPNARNGIYRLERGGAFTLVADTGQWSITTRRCRRSSSTPACTTPWSPLGADSWSTDGHDNRVLWVSGRGSVKEVVAFGNVVPTGLEVSKGRAFITQAGPIPHEPEAGKVLVLVGPSGATEIASGASMLMDVERGPNGKLYALSQGRWDGVAEGTPALPDTGRAGDRRTRREPDPRRSPTPTRARARPSDVHGDRG